MFTEYELFRIKQQLLLDDWSILEGMILKYAEQNKTMIFDSQLHMDEQLVLVSGDYMDRLSVVGHLHAEI